MALDKQTSADEISPLRFLLDARSGVPTYLQLVQQVEQALRLGILREGDQLPRVKDAVTALAINPNTVLKAYRELALRGLATTRPGVGTFVHESLPVIDLAGQATDQDAPTADRCRAAQTTAATPSASSANRRTRTPRSVPIA